MPAMEPAAATQELTAWIEEFEAAARRPLPLRLRYAFIHTYKPVLDDAPFRAFDTMADYRAWCEEPSRLAGLWPRLSTARPRKSATRFARHGVRYLFIGKSGAILLGFPDTTQDADLFVDRGPETARRWSPHCANSAST